jgi:hypothetical protein
MLKLSAGWKFVRGFHMVGLRDFSARRDRNRNHNRNFSASADSGMKKKAMAFSISAEREVVDERRAA